MSRLRKRNGEYLKDSSGSPAWGSSTDVIAYPVGAQANGGQASTTINVRAGHGFRKDDYLIVNTDASKFRKVTLVAPGQLTLDASLTVSDADLLVNLGPDTATGGTPDYDGSPVLIYADMAGETTALTDAKVSTDSEGKYSFWSYNQRIWELLLDGTRPVAVRPDVFEDQEVDNTDSARSFGATGDGTTDDKDALEAALEAADAVTNGRVLLTTGTYKVDDDLTVPTGVQLEFASDAQIKMAAGKTLTIDGYVTAGRNQIFDAAIDEVVFTEQATVFPEWWGADVTGGSTSTAAFDKSIAALQNGGIVLGAGPAATYLFATSPANITKSELTLDFQGALLKSGSTVRFTFDGDPGPLNPGIWTSAVQNSHFLNARIGDAASNKMLGPMLTWCEDCSVQNVVKRGDTNTAFNMRVCRRCTFRDVWNYGANTAGGFFGFLLHIVWDCVVENCHVRDGACAFGFQVKGGRNNRVLNCSIENQTGTGVDEGFKDRGDTPWGVSGTTGVTYPWPTGSWDTADDRRACHNTVFLNCSVEASPDVLAFTSQESFGTVFENVFWNDVKSGIVVKRLGAIGAPPVGKERDFVIKNPRGQKAGTTGSYTDAGIGIICAGEFTNQLPGVQILGGHVDECEAHGVLVEECDNILIDGLEVKNSNQGDDSKDGVRIEENCTRPTVVNVSAYDDQTSATQTVGINVAPTCTRPIIQGCSAWGNTSEQIRSFLPGYYEGNSPGEATVQTVGNVTIKNRLDFNIETGTTVWIEVTATAMEGTANRGLWWIGGLFGLDAMGNAVKSGATQVLAGPINDWVAPTPDVTFNPTGAKVRVWVKGDVDGATIDWVMRARTIIVG